MLSYVLKGQMFWNSILILTIAISKVQNNKILEFFWYLFIHIDSNTENEIIESPHDTKRLPRAFFYACYSQKLEDS